MSRRAGHPGHCPATCQFSCNVWHSVLCLADSHLCLLSLELPKHPLSFCSLTSAWAPWHRSAWSFCVVPSAARCCRVPWLSSSQPTTHTGVDKGCSPEPLHCAGLALLVFWKLQPAGCISLFFYCFCCIIPNSFLWLAQNSCLSLSGNCEFKGVNSSSGVFSSETSKGLAKGDEGCLPASHGKSVPLQGTAVRSADWLLHSAFSVAKRVLCRSIRAFLWVHW